MDYDKKSFLQSLELLGYGQRVDKMVELALASKENDQYSKLLFSLLNDGVYEGSLALIGAAITYNSAVIIKGLRHKSNIIKSKAVGLLVKICSANDIEKEIEELSYKCRRKLLKNIAIRNRRDIAEILLPAVYSKWGEEEASILLPACTEETVAKWIQKLEYSIMNWKRLASRYPNIVLDRFRIRLENVESENRGDVWIDFIHGIKLLYKENGDFILDCAIKFGLTSWVYSNFMEEIGVLSMVNSDKVYKLIIQEELREGILRSGIPVAMLKRKKYFSKEQWIEIGKILSGATYYTGELLSYMEPWQRGEIFEGIYPSDQRQGIVFDKYILQYLPKQLRDKETIRILGLKDIKGNHESTLSYIECRHISISREILERKSFKSNSNERGKALESLIISTILSGEGMSETLQFLRKIKNDQDSIKYMVFQALLRCNPDVFKWEDLKNLNFLVDSVMDARDTSDKTLQTMQIFAVNLIKRCRGGSYGVLRDLALDIILKIVKKTGNIEVNLKGQLEDGVARELFKKLYPLILKQGKLENYKPAINLSIVLGKAGYDIKELQELLKEATLSRNPYISKEGVYEWLANKELRDERVRELLKIDKSFITIDIVYLHLHNNRQEWLDPFIKGDIIKGKFLTGKKSYVFLVKDGFYKWLPRQQKLLGNVLEEIALDPNRSSLDRIEAIKQIFVMTDFIPARIEKILTNDDIAIVEAALEGFAKYQRKEDVIPVLLKNLNNDRARVAMYSLSRVLMEINPILVEEIINDLLSNSFKVTVKKETIRILGRYRDENSIKKLLEQFEKPNQHKDVLVEIGHVVSNFLNYKEAWIILNSIAKSANREVFKSLFAPSIQTISKKYRDDYVNFVCKVINDNNDFLDSSVFDSIDGWVNSNKEAIANIAAKTITNLECGDIWKCAARTLVSTAGNEVSNKILINVIEELSNIQLIDEWNATAQIDLPHRQRLLYLTELLTTGSYFYRKNFTELYKVIINNNFKDYKLKFCTVKFYMALIDWSNIDEAIEYIESIGDCIKRQRYLENKVYRYIAAVLKGDLKVVDSKLILNVITKIMENNNREIQIIGIYMIRVVGNYLRWNRDCCEILKIYRSNKDIDIQVLALDIFTKWECKEVSWKYR